MNEGGGIAPGDDFRFFTPEQTWSIVRFTVGDHLLRFFRVHSYGLERVPMSGPVVVASNHIAGIDPILLGATIQRVVRYMAKAELFTYNPIMASVLRHAGVFAVRRGESDLAALRLGRAVLEAGHLLGVFAEGTRQSSEAIGQIKPGAAMIALPVGAPIVPVVIQGSIHTKKHIRSPVTIVFGEPMRYPGVPRSGRLLRDAVHQATADLQVEMERLQRFAQAAVKAGRPRRALPPVAATRPAP